MQEITTYLRRSFLDPFKRFIQINSDFIQYENKKIKMNQIKEIRYGILQMYINGIKANRIYEIGVNDKENNSIRITFQSSRLFVTNKELEQKYIDIVNILEEYITKPLAIEAIENLKQGKKFLTQNLEIHPKGILMNLRRWFFKKESFFVEWKNLRKYYEEGNLCIYSEENKRIQLKLNFQKDWNTHVLSLVLEYLWKDGNAYSLAEDRF